MLCPGVLCANVLRSAQVRNHSLTMGQDPLERERPREPSPQSPPVGAFPPGRRLPDAYTRSDLPCFGSDVESPVKASRAARRRGVLDTPAKLVYLSVDEDVGLGDTKLTDDDACSHMSALACPGPRKDSDC